MTDRSTARKIFEKWCVDYMDMDKSMENVYNNFAMLFTELDDFRVPWDVARDYADKAIEFHMPSNSTAKFVYKIKNKTHIPFKDWVADWKEAIKQKGLHVFYEVYPIEDEPVKKSRKLKGDGKKSTDEINSEDFYKSSKLVSKEKPLLFGDE